VQPLPAGRARGKEVTQRVAKKKKAKKKK